MAITKILFDKKTYAEQLLGRTIIDPTSGLKIYVMQRGWRPQIYKPQHTTIPSGEVNGIAEVEGEVYFSCGFYVGTTWMDDGPDIAWFKLDDLYAKRGVYNSLKIAMFSPLERRNTWQLKRCSLI